MSHAAKNGFYGRTISLGTGPITPPVLLAAALLAHVAAALGVHVSAWPGEDGWRGGPGPGAGGPDGRLAEQFGERGDGFEQQGVDAGLLVGGAAGAEFGDGAAGVRLGGGVAYPGGDGRAGDGRGPGCRGAGRGLAGHGQSRVSSATAFFAQVSSMRSWPAAAPAMVAAVAALL